ncbi:hypothetical protein QC761_400630 [Podospora bellae-mahoneyi]|uniref:ATP-dependent RNA helicase n=1 Tax=Podospora bellae-mahoneyi TaxID=2093777 RepID=A0ABR0FIG5_9PEZI|nr:hypothetical protein QC761_400630 [Podospora bellae-mahoneyi]
MAGKKKTKKPAANPARGFATTSIASKPRADPAEAAADTPAGKGDDAAAPPAADAKDAPQAAGTTNTTNAPKAKELSPEEFERQLEESALQILVDKYAAKVRRDAQRIKTRLETDRRILRGQAETINTRKWLPQELMDHVLDLIQAEARFAASSVTSEGATSRLPPEEDLIIKLWTLQQTLENTDFPKDRVQPALQFALDIAPNISPNVKSDSIWGLEEILDWLARECSKAELPDYSGRKPGSGKAQGDISADSPLPSGATTPFDLEPRRGQKGKNGAPDRSRQPSPKKSNVTYDEDIEPDQLLPLYLETQEKLFEIRRPRQDVAKGKGGAKGNTVADPEEALCLAKLDRIEKDVLFDKYVAEQQWRDKKIALEKDYATAKAEAKKKQAEEEPAPAPTAETDDINEEAERIAAEILAEQDDDEDGALADLFASLPVNEVDPLTGKSNTVMNGADGSKVTIRDFGKWTGVSPIRVLEEACRSRDSSVRISYHVLSDIAFANRHAVKIVWSKPQEIPPPPESTEIEVFMSPTQFVYKMISISTSDLKQSEAYIATTALFCIFGSSGKEEKVALRLPATWKDLWSEMAEAKKNKADGLDRDALRHLRDMVRTRMEQELEDGVLIQGFKGRGQSKNLTDSDQSDNERVKRQSFDPEYYRNIWLQKAQTPRFQVMLQSRVQLPMWQFREQVVNAVEQNQVVIVCGETGCGKSTQVPSFLLEDQLMKGRPCKIYCTEPRRISALSLAKRVSEELGENKGDLGTSRSLVGYSIRLESNTCRETRLVYATTGIVMRMLESSNDLQEITHLVLDEVHERSIDSDFLLIVLKKLLIRRKDLKVVLMSATVDAERFSKYLSGAPVLTVPGRTFPVSVAYLEDAVELTGYSLDTRPAKEKFTDLDDDVEAEIDNSSKPELIKALRQYSPRTRNTLAAMDEYQIDFDLVLQLISRIAVDPNYTDFSKAILVFLPGIAEIRTLNDMLLGDKFFAENWLVYPLHSSIATEEQEAAFLVPPPGVRKIVLATNIAETGITIPDVTCVIDTGKHREMRFDERRQLSRLIDTFISRANAKQRRGRAGRVQEGLCFHMFTKYRHDNIMSDQQTPEMLRLSLQELAIRVKTCKIGGIEETLGEALDPPSAKNIRRAIDALVDVRALTASSEELTPLGLQLARLPLDVFLGKLILLGSIFKCLDMTVTVAAILSSKSPFIAPFGQRSQADTVRRGFRKGDSDLLTVYNAYSAWKRVCQSSASSGAEYQFCRKNFLSPQTLANIEDLKGQLITSVVDSGFLQLTAEERQAHNRLRFGGRRRRSGQVFFEIPKRVDGNSDNEVVAQSVIAWSFYPKLLVREGKGWRNVGNNQAIQLHPSSVNKGGGNGEVKWMSYYHIMQNKQFLNAHETTAVDPFAVALLCGDVRADLYSGVLVLDGNRARFAVPDWKTMLVMKVLRARLREMLARCFKSPGRLVTAQQERWLEVWQRIFGLAWEVREREREKGGGGVAGGKELR